MIPRECHCGHVMLEHEFHGRCLVERCACARYDEKVSGAGADGSGRGETATPAGRQDR